jgi:hypothetical protein
MALEAPRLSLPVAPPSSLELASSPLLELGAVPRLLLPVEHRSSSAAAVEVVSLEVSLPVEHRSSSAAAVEVVSLEASLPVEHRSSRGQSERRKPPGGNAASARNIQCQTRINEAGGASGDAR